MKPIVIYPSETAIHLIEGGFIETTAGETYIGIGELMYNTKYVLKRGAIGSVMKFKLSDESGGVNLHGWTVTLTARRNAGEAVIGDAVCQMDADQFNKPGDGSFTFAEDAAQIPAGRYAMEFKAVKDGITRYFPANQRQQFGELIVQESLS